MGIRATDITSLQFVVSAGPFAWPPVEITPLGPKIEAPGKISFFYIHLSAF